MIADYQLLFPHVDHGDDDGGNDDGSDNDNGDGGDDNDDDGGDDNDDDGGDDDCQLTHLACARVAGKASKMENLKSFVLDSVLRFTSSSSSKSSKSSSSSSGE